MMNGWKKIFVSAVFSKWALGLKGIISKSLLTLNRFRTVMGPSVDLDFFCDIVDLRG